MDKNMKILLIVVVVAVALIAVFFIGSVLMWQTGAFNPESGTAPGMKGFSMVRPNEWSCRGGDITITIVNTAGAAITGASIEGGECVPDLVRAGDDSLCTIANAPGCTGVNKGDRFESDITISYSSENGMARTSSGAIWGDAE